MVIALVFGLVSLQPQAVNPDELAKTAREVLAQAAASTTAPDALLPACASKWAPDGCAAKLAELAHRNSASIDARVHAAGILVTMKQPGAPGQLLGLLKALPPLRFAAFSREIQSLPAADAIPLLDAELHSNAAAAQIAACRALGAIDSSDSRRILSTFVPAAPYATQVYYACLLASAKLGDPANRTTAGYMWNRYTGENLIAYAELTMNENRDLSVGFLQKVTREESGPVRIEAARALAPILPDAAKNVIEQGLADPQPATRAAALQVFADLGLQPPPAVGALMRDANPLVRVRAAEAVLAASKAK